MGIYKVKGQGNGESSSSVDYMKEDTFLLKCAMVKYQHSRGHHQYHLCHHLHSQIVFDSTTRSPTFAEHFSSSHLHCEYVELRT